MDSLLAFTAALAAGIRLGTPIALAAIGETLSQRAGVINVGLEGVMLVGAIIAVLVTVATGNPWLGLLAAIASGMAFSAIHAFYAVYLKVDQIVSGIALLLVGIGLSGVIFRLTLAAQGTAIQVPGFSPMDVAGLGRIPVVGPLIFGQYALVYLMLASAIALLLLLNRTRLGLIVKAVGDAPDAADATGIPVDRVRFFCVIAGGAFAGAGGAYLSIAQLWGFVENMTAGRGFLAIACVVFARWNPVLAMVVAIVFGIADAVQIRLQSAYPEIPYQLFVIVPYAVALLSLAIASRSSRMPNALGIPFTGR